MTMEEQSGGTVEWTSMILTLDVIKQGRLGEFSVHKTKIAF